MTSSMSSHHSSNQYVRRAPASYLRAHPSTWKDCPAPRLSRVTAAPSSLAAYRERSASRSYSRERREVDVVTMRERTPYSSVQAGGRSPRDRSWDPRGSRSPLEAMRFVFPRQASEGGRGYGTRLEVEKEKGGLKRQERVEVTPAASPALVKMREMIASLSMEGEDEQEEEGDYESEDDEEVSIAVPILANMPKRRLSEPVVAPLAPEEEEDEEDEDEEWDEDEEEEEEEEEGEEEEPVVPTQRLVLKPPPDPLAVRLIPKIAPVVPPKPSLNLIQSTPEVEQNEEEDESEEEQSISLTLPNIWNQSMHVSSSLPCKLVELDEEEDEEDEEDEEEEDEEEGDVAFDLESEEDEEEEEEETELPSGSKSLSEILFGVDPADRRVLLRLLEGESSLISKEQVGEIRSQLEKAGLVIDVEEEEEEELSPELVLPSKVAVVHESEEEDEDEEEEDAPSTSGVCEDEDEEEWEEGDEELMEYGEEWIKPGFQSSTGAPPSGIGRSPSIGSTPTNRDGLSTSVSRVAPRVASSTATSGGISDRSTAQFAAPTISSTAAANVNYRLLYEKERTENEKLRRELERSGAPPPEMNGSSSSTGLSSTRRLPTRLTSSQSVVGGLSKSPSGGSMEDAERRTLERRITELELELKSLGQLRLENQRLKEENGALVRVISKMTI